MFANLRLLESIAGRDSSLDLSRERSSTVWGGEIAERLVTTVAVEKEFALERSPETDRLASEDTDRMTYEVMSEKCESWELWEISIGAVG